MNALLTKWKAKARDLKTETYALYFACRDARTPWYAKLVAASVVGYAFSPIDLIPDFIPVLGLLDDLILIPLGIALVLRLIPEQVMAESRQKARELMSDGKPRNRIAAFIIILIWLILAVLTGYLLLRVINNS